MYNWPSVAIIILNWNGWRDTIECLESVCRITYPNYEVIVIDNGSSDDSMDKIKVWAKGNQEVLTPKPSHPLYHLSHPPLKKPIPYIEYNRKDAEPGDDSELEERSFNFGQIPNPMIQVTHSPLILIQTGENLGFAGGSNVGIRYVLEKGNNDYVLLLNNDTVVCQDFLNKMIYSAISADNIGIVGGKILYYDTPDLIWYCGGTLDLWRGVSHHKYHRKRNNSLGEITGATFITGCLMLINKKVFETVGFLPEEYFLYLEDTAFCYSVLKKGFKLKVTSASMIFHKISSIKEENYPLGLYYATRNRLYFMLTKQQNKIYLFSFLLFFSCGRSIKICQYFVEGKKKLIGAICKGIKDALNGRLGEYRNIRF